MRFAAYVYLCRRGVLTCPPFAFDDTVLASRSDSIDDPNRTAPAPFVGFSAVIHAAQLHMTCWLFRH